MLTSPDPLKSLALEVVSLLKIIFKIFLHKFVMPKDVTHSQECVLEIFSETMLGLQEHFQRRVVFAD